MMNLHDIVRGAIPALHPDEDVLLVQSTGSENVRGVVTPQYAAPVLVGAQIQSMGSDELMAMNEVSRTEISRKVWLYSKTPSGLLPQTIVRMLERGGDLMRRADGSWWLVTGLMEDFSGAGWVSVHIVRQITVPDAVLELAAAWDAAQG